MQSKLPSKKFINKKENVVQEALQGFCMLNPSITILQDKQTVVLKQNVQNQVVLLCGGGSGHEPAHGGFVDPKILQAAVCGGVFASPSYQQIQGALQHIGKNNKGILVIIKNYTGDVINFELASGFARTLGLDVKTLIVADDIAFVQNSNDIEKRQEARGLTGTVLLYKILGAAAHQGKDLEYIHNFGQKILENIFSLGASMSSCSLPGMQATFQIGSNEVEIGLGIHGEQGKGRQQYTEVNEIVKQMLEQYFYEKFINKGDEVVVLINNLGSCTDLETAIFSREVILQLQKNNIKVERISEGRIMTSLEMQGILLTIFKLEKDYKQEVLQYIDLPVDSKNWNVSKPQCNLEETVSKFDQSNEQSFYTKTVKDLNQQGNDFKELIKKIFTSLLTKEEYFNKLDSEVGDGDTGSGLARASQEVLNNIDFLQFDTQFNKSIIALGEIIANSFGGTSGPLYGNFLSQASQFLKSNIDENNVSDFSMAFEAGVKGVQQLGKAELGQRTMYDVIQPLSEKFKEIAQINDLNKKDIAQQLYQFSCQLSEKASQFKAGKGRARYLDGKEIGKKDPGCELVCEWINLIQQNL